MSDKVRCKHWGNCSIACKGKSFIAAWRVSKLPGCFEDAVSQPAPEPATECAGDDEPQGEQWQLERDIMRAALRKTHNDLDLCQRELERSRAELIIERNGSAALFRVSKDMEIAMTGMRAELDDAEREIVRRIDTAVKRDEQGKQLRKEHETTHLENIQLRAELAELKRLGVAAALARIASGEVVE